MISLYFQNRLYNLSLINSKMQQNPSEFEVVISQTEYKRLQERLREMEEGNQSLKASLKQMEDDAARKSLIIKGYQKKIRTISRECLNNAKRILEFDQTSNQVKEENQSIHRHATQLESKLIREIKSQQMKIQGLLNKVGHYKNTIKTLQNKVQFRESQVQQLIIQNSQKKKIISQIQSKCIKLQQQIGVKQAKERIIVDDNQEDLLQLRQKVKQIEIQNKRLKGQLEENAKSMAAFAPILQRYYDQSNSQQAKLLNSYWSCLDSYKKKLIEATLVDTDITEQLNLKRKAIDRALAVEYERIKLEK